MLWVAGPYAQISVAPSGRYHIEAVLNSELK